MLQRIQTVYLLLAAGLMTAMCLSPLGRYAVDGVEDAFMAFDFWWLGVLLALCALVPFVTIWLFKNRFLQIRLCCAEVVLLLGAQGFALWYAVRFGNVAESMGNATMSQVCTPVVFPIVALILTIMAIRGIVKDERLVRSLDRVR